MKNNYILKNIFIFVLTVTLILVSITVYNYYSIDTELWQIKKEELNKRNNSFAQKTQALLSEQFSAVEFIASTSLPAVALEFQMHNQFFDNVKNVYGSQKITWAFYDKTGTLITKSGADDVRIATKINKPNKFYYTKKYTIALYPIYSLDSLLGYLAGIIPNDTIRSFIYTQYLKETHDLTLLGPTLSIDFNNQNKPTLNFISKNNPESLLKLNNKNLYFIIIASLLIIALFSILLSKSLKQPIHKLIQLIKESTNTEKPLESAPEMGDKNFQNIANAIIEMDSHRKKLENEKRQQEIMMQIAESAAQVSHDIMSPLSVLESLIPYLDKLPEDKRIIFRRSVQRIQDIANDLNRKKIAQNKDVVENCLLTSLIEDVVSEKRFQFRSKFNIQINYPITTKSYGLFANVNPSTFKRVLSNIINNAIEACEEEGCIEVSAKRNESSLIVITIQDNGPGIPSSIINQIGNKGVTQNKSNGSGLGLYHAKKSVEEWNGELKIVSSSDKGTTIEIVLPEIKQPSWFTSIIKLNSRKICIIDDDYTVHHIWMDRINKLTQNQIDFMNFTDPDLFSTWMYSNDHEDYIFLVDYEFLNHETNGIKLITDFNISHKSYLVTSRFDEESVREECIKHNIKIIPKGLAAYTPLQQVKAADRDATKVYDHVLLDDNYLIRLNWEMQAKDNNLNVLTFENSHELYDQLQYIHQNTPIYLDQHISDNEKGIDIAIELKSKGYSNLYLASGLDEDEIKAPEGLFKGYCGKKPPTTSNKPATNKS